MNKSFFDIKTIITAVEMLRTVIGCFYSEKAFAYIFFK